MSNLTDSEKTAPAQGGSVWMLYCEEEPETGELTPVEWQAVIDGGVYGLPLDADLWPVWQDGYRMAYYPLS